MTEVNNNISQKIPILIRISSLIILVMGIVGLLFFVFVGIYQYYNPEFLKSISADSGKYLHLNWYIIILLILHIGIIISSLLIIKLKRTGIYLFLSVFFAMLLTEFIFDNKLILYYLVGGLFIVFIIILYYRRFK
jgi:drug/metabolite transporter (DMT)-like permease